ncbi:MAG: hypothetical protein Q4D26_12035 [Clostridia bacterium]|nr:hypothetical protein [Clostridia bacterium]
MKRKLCIIAALAVTAVFSLSGCGSTQSSVTDTGSSDAEAAEVVTEVPAEAVTEAPAISISAEDLMSAYESNEVSADKQYKDQKLSVTGVVDNISTVLDQTTVTLTNGDEFAFTGVRCYFDDEGEIDKVANLSKGTTITVEGTCDGYTIEPVMKDCIIK